MALRESAHAANARPDPPGGAAGKVAAPASSEGGAASADGVSGDALARAIRNAPGTSGTTPAGGGATGADIRAAIARESQHEVVALMGRELTVNWSNFNRYRAGADAGAPTMVVSFLGDTSVGKSTTIAALMGDDADRPHVQRGREQTASTTFNVNLYRCTSLAPGLAVSFLDFEGESGSETPLMAEGGGGGRKAGGPKGSGAGASSGGAGAIMSQTAKLLGLDAAATAARGFGSPLARAEAVREAFPKLAYCVSDVVVLVGTEPFFSTCVHALGCREGGWGERRAGALATSYLPVRRAAGRHLLI